MANADQSLNIAIRIITEELGPEKADQILKKVTAATKDSGKEFKLFAGHSKEVNKVVGELTRGFPLAGMALRAFVNPIGAALTLAVFAFRAFKTHIEEVNKALDAMAQSGAEKVGDMAKSLAEAHHNAAIRAEEFAIALKHAGENADPLKTKYEDQLKLINDVVTAYGEQLKAREALDLAEAKDSPEAQERIKNRYANLRRNFEDDTDATKLAVLKSERDRRTAQQSGLTSEAGKAAAAVTITDALLTDNPKQIASLQRMLGERGGDGKPATGILARQSAADLHFEKWDTVRKQSAGFGQFDGFANPQAKLEWQKARDEKEKADAAVQANQRLTARLERERTELETRKQRLDDEAATSTRAATENRTRLTELDRVIPAEEQSTGIRRETRTRVGILEAATAATGRGQGETARSVLSAAAGADAVRGGGKATADQSAAINQLTKMLGLTGQNQETILRILGSLNDNEDKFTRALKTLEARINRIPSHG